MAAAAAAIACTVFWAVAQDVSLGVMGYGARVGTFVAIGVIVGLQAQKRLRLEGERERLIAELRATALRDQLTGCPTAAPGTTGSTRSSRSLSAPGGRSASRCSTSTGSNRSTTRTVMKRAIG